jgi:hypothetical protein
MSNGFMNGKRDGLKHALIFLGVTSGILTSGYYVYKEARKESRTQPADPEVVTGPSKRVEVDTPEPPVADGGGGIIFADENDTDVFSSDPGSTEVTTFETPPDTVDTISDDVPTAINQIKDLANQIGLTQSKEQQDIVNVETFKVVTQTPDGPVEKKVFITADGRQLNSEQEVLDEFIKVSISPEVVGELNAGTNKSTLDALFAGSPINVTNFITEAPKNFPKAKVDSDFQRRAQALQPTLTVDNPGASSSSRIPNFSRLAATGVDLSKVDPFGVANPDFLSDIKDGQGPLTEAQRIAVDQQRLKTDPRNMTSSERQEIQDNRDRRAAENQVVTVRATALKEAGFDEAKAKEFLRSKGFAVRGTLTPETFANLERQLA